MDLVWVALMLVTVIYLVGLVSFLQKVILSRREKGNIDRRLMFWAVIGGTILIFLIVSKVLQS